MSVKIFFCYAHEDELLLKQLKAHLSPLLHEGLIDVWYDGEISAGTDWEQQIKEQLNTAQIILLLVSPDFMNSDYCYGIEMKRALERHERGEARVIPVILRHIHWQGVLGKLQALPKNALPITDPDWHGIDRAFYNVTEGLRKIVEEVQPSINEIFSKICPSCNGTGKNRNKYMSASGVVSSSIDETDCSTCNATGRVPDGYFTGLIFAYVRCHNCGNKTLYDQKNRERQRCSKCGASWY